MSKEAPAQVMSGPDKGSFSVVSEVKERPKLLLKRPTRGVATVEYNPDGSFNLGLLNHVKDATTSFAGPLDEVPGRLLRLAREEKIDVKKIAGIAIVRDEASDPDVDYQQKVDAIQTFYDNHDISPIFISREEAKKHLSNSNSTENPLIGISRIISKKFNTHGSEKVEPDPETGRVHALETVTLESLKKHYPQYFWEESMAIINDAVKENRHSIIVRKNTTAKAGGVAGMNLPMDATIGAINANERRKIKKGEEGHETDFRWDVLDKFIDPEIAAKYGIDLKDPELLARYEDKKNPGTIDIFRLTKKRHNLIQDAAQPEDDYDDLDERLYQAWGESQYITKFKELRKALKELKNNPNAKKLKIILDDQQLAFAAKYIHADNPDVLPVYRSHIQFKDTPKAKKVTESILRDITDSEGKPLVAAFISHRSRDEQMDEFVPKGPDGQIDSRIADIAMYKVATADQLGELERYMDSELARPYWQDINYYLMKTGQTPIMPEDVEVGFVGQFARHDPAKNHDGAVEAAVMRIDRMHKAGVPLELIPGQIIAGFGAVDDPDGEWVEAKIRNLVKEKHLQLKDSIPTLMHKIKVFRFDYNEYSGQHMNVLQRACVLGEQLSHAEGCEDKITQLLQMNIPVLVADVGGMPPQIVDGKTGIKIKDQKDHKAIADIQFDLLYERWLKQQYPEMIPGPTKLEEMTENTKTMVNWEYTTLANIRDIMGLATVLNHPEHIPQMVREFREANGGQLPFVKDIVFADFNRRKQEKTQIPHQSSEPTVVFSA